MRRKWILLVSISLLLGLSGCGKQEVEPETEETVAGEAVEEEAPEQEPEEVSKDFEGEWNRTEVHSGYESTIEITEQTSDVFHVAVYAGYFTSEGTYEGEAKLLTDHIAVLEDPDYPQSTIFFLLKNDALEVLSDGDGNLGFEENVSMTGTYITGTPVYTNAEVLNEKFSDDELKSIKKLVGDDLYENFFLLIVENGFVDGGIQEDGVCYYKGSLPTMEDYEFELLMTEEGNYYFVSRESGYLTTDESMKNQMPEFFTTEISETPEDSEEAQDSETSGQEQAK